jgi:hypothetical protein
MTIEMAPVENLPPAMIDTGGKLPPASWTSEAALPLVSSLSVYNIGEDTTCSVVGTGAVVKWCPSSSCEFLREFSQKILYVIMELYGVGRRRFMKKNLKPKT